MPSTTKQSKKKPTNNSRSRFCSFIYVFLIVLAGLASAAMTWWRTEKINVGYCGTGKPHWAGEGLMAGPRCETCPLHATCTYQFEAQCDKDYQLERAWLSFGGWFPLPPRCRATSGKARQISDIAERLAQAVRERQSWWWEPRVEVPVVAVKEEALRDYPLAGDDVHDDIWPAALQEVVHRGDVEICSGQLSSNATLVSTSRTLVCRAHSLMTVKVIWAVLAIFLVLVVILGRFYKQPRPEVEREVEREVEHPRRSSRNVHKPPRKE